ncbi:MAG: hypothetical protein ABIF17_01850 [Patescibacteria group bacterium]
MEHLPSQDAEKIQTVINELIIENKNPENLKKNLLELSKEGLLPEFCLCIIEQCIKKEEHKKAFNEMEKLGVYKLADIIKSLLQQKEK